MEGPERPLPTDTRTVVLVEGASDRRAVEALAGRRGRSLLAEGIAVVAMGGATNITKFLVYYGPTGRNLRVAGLYDQGEVRFFRRGLARAGLGDNLSVAAMAALGFHPCVVDLEDELIRALGVSATERLLAENDDLAAFRTMEQQPASIGRPTLALLHRFMGTRGGRKIRYATLMVDALPLDEVPRPLRMLVDQL
ncbi:TOPRIM nucleotidyl transferase/hydrolase domain-containing protein [Nakamurella panacisegetis]|nr:TOPRIM nucleotidyl transferase/hydrolase domain-containing protein [Nakamurella panacisegetis]